MKKYDMIFTCPPYFDLEVYSNNKKRILVTSKSYEEFLKVYKNIFAQAVEKTKQQPLCSNSWQEK